MQTPFRLPLLTALILATTAAWAADAPVKGGTLIYLEQQAHTNLYPPAGGTNSDAQSGPGGYAAVCRRRPCQRAE